MFTGIIEQLSNIVDAKRTSDGSMRLTLGRPPKFEIQLGDSISVDGCCLTVAAFDEKTMHFDLSSETLAKTKADAYAVGMTTNIERALSFGGRLGGHLVSGHVDSIGIFSIVEQRSAGWVLAVKFERQHAALVIPKGSIAIDGVSLTVNEIQDLPSECEVKVMLIPTTLQKTTLSAAVIGQRVNLEFDLMGKYILRQKTIAF